MSLPEAVQQTDAWDKSKASVGAAHGAKAPTDDENVRRGGEEGGRTTTGSKGVALRATETTDMTGGGEECGARVGKDWIVLARDEPHPLSLMCGWRSAVAHKLV